MADGPSRFEPSAIHHQPSAIRDVYHDLVPSAPAVDGHPLQRSGGIRLDAEDRQDVVAVLGAAGAVAVHGHWLGRPPPADGSPARRPAGSSAPAPRRSSRAPSPAGTPAARASAARPGHHSRSPGPAARSLPARASRAPRPAAAERRARGEPLPPA